MRAFLAALSILSIFPLGKFCPTENELKRSLNYFPLAGALFGIIFYFIALGVGAVCAPLPTAMLLALLPEVLTKGFHLDGLADTADAFLSGRDRARKLEIMRDSHIGTMGVGAIVALIGMKFALFASLKTDALPAAAATMMFSGRAAIVLYVSMSRYARDKGLGALWFGHKAVAGIFLSLILSGAAGYYFYALPGLLFPVLLLTGAFIWSRISYAVIGGATGDTIGCCEEISELLSLALVVIIITVAI